MELTKRLQDIGIGTVYCWADKESEGFWLKQGFVLIAKVDKKGRACRLPIKMDIHKAMCFPGGPTLMVSHLRKYTSGPAESLKFHFPLNPSEKSSPSAADKSIGQRRADAAVNLCSCSSQGAKRKILEASLSSLKTKKVKGGHNIDHQTDSDYLVSESYRNFSCFHECSLGISTDKSTTESTTEVTPRIFIKNSMEDNSEEGGPVSVASQAPTCKELQANKKSFEIMLMDTAVDTKKERPVEDTYVSECSATHGLDSATWPRMDNAAWDVANGGCYGKFMCGIGSQVNPKELGFRYRKWMLKDVDLMSLMLEDMVEQQARDAEERAMDWELRGREAEERVKDRELRWQLIAGMAKIQTNIGKIVADLVAALASYGILPRVGGPSFRPPYDGGEPDPVGSVGPALRLHADLPLIVTHGR